MSESLDLTRYSMKALRSALPDPDVENRIVDNILGQLKASSPPNAQSEMLASPERDMNSELSSKKLDDENANGPSIKWRWVDPITQIEFSGSRRISGPVELQERKRTLPIFQFRPQFIHAVVNNQVVVIVGETGSGKSTQMPQYLLEEGLIVGRIAVTQPRRVATVSVAKRVAQEIGCTLGDLVGYSIRFEDVSSSQTVVKYVTDGLLLMECLKDPLFSSYGCVILDEAHERTLHTDVLLGLLKKALSKRPELKLIITSATLDIRKFANYFEAPMLRIPGKMFPVRVEFLPDTVDVQVGHHREQVFLPPLIDRANKNDFFVQISVAKALEIHRQDSCKTNGILLFLPGKDEVEQACAILSKNNIDKDLIALPVYAALPFDSQCAIFSVSPPSQRKIVVATNIAETSLTIDGVAYVIDSGLFKLNIYDRGIDTLKVSVISKAQAEQRAGRAGRTAPGLCFRLYTVMDYLTMDEVPAPAIHRIDLTATTLQLKAMGIDDICGFGFMDAPKPDRVLYSLERLRDLGALNSDYKVTEVGFKMAKFPLSPNLAKILLTAAEMGCSNEVLTIVSMLSVNYIFVRPKKRQNEADARKRQFDDPKGDHISLLKVFTAWMNSGKSEDWARRNYVHQKELEKALDIRIQLQSLMELNNVPIIGADGRRLSNIRRALASGSPNNVAFRDHFALEPNAYRTLIDRKLVFIHPSSVLFKINPELVIYHETTTTSRNFMRFVSICEKSWIENIPYWK